MRHILSILAILFISVSLFAQNNDEEYNKVLQQRADKIVKTLGVRNQAVYDEVVDIIADQYKGLGTIHDSANEQIKATKKNIQNKEQKETAVKNIENDRDAQLYKLHCAYIGALSVYLTNDQIEKVKDGMTYGVVKVTYDSYLDMIPTLKQGEKDQLYAWLVEAREYAMSESSSKKKHEWFGKYKGRFNNYLSKNGYNLQKEREEWTKRIQERESADK
ncbi:DUF3826 domain-containing protein [Dysgonomonas sp. 511]|uniref:DUF3826 domain-containing protein n=1 Tax=Dysgonomonas sp. 511 TaxID=2302930 RepID=UPI0013D2054E|nr:DUF3826 domain-containing protein [Dysgonomonas sp. 511]NDV78087.1 DUF3826 domain-containing protein [Dysgonomonas sp. 511]